MGWLGNEVWTWARVLSNFLPSSCCCCSIEKISNLSPLNNSQPFFLLCCITFIDLVQEEGQLYRFNYPESNQTLWDVLSVWPREMSCRQIVASISFPISPPRWHSLLLFTSIFRGSITSLLSPFKPLKSNEAWLFICDTCWDKKIKPHPTTYGITALQFNELETLPFAWKNIGTVKNNFIVFLTQKKLYLQFKKTITRFYLN